MVIGIVAVALGAGWIVLGYRLALILLPIWGFFAGFIFGAHVLQELLGQGFLATTLSWVAGAVVGLVFAVLSYLFWYVAVVIAFASVGYWLGWGFMILIGFAFPAARSAEWYTGCQKRRMYSPASVPGPV